MTAPTVERSALANGDDRIDPVAQISVHTNGRFYRPIEIKGHRFPDGRVMIDIGPVCIHLDDVDALADLHQRIGRQLVEMQRDGEQDAA